MSQEELPSGSLPEDLEKSVADIIRDVGISILTVKMLRRRLEAKYKIEFTSHNAAVSACLTRLMQTPEFRKELAKAHQQANEGPIGGKGKKRPRSSKSDTQPAKASKREAKAKKPDDYPKAALSPYFLFGGDVREKIKAENPGLKNTEILSKQGEMWAQASEEVKESYKKRAEEDKARFERELEAYKARGGVEIHRRGKKDAKAKKPDDYPKAALSPYFLFGGDVREKIKAENPGLKNTEILSKQGEMWAQASEEVKESYKKRAEEDKARFERELEAYKARGGVEIHRRGKKDAKAKREPRANRAKKAPSEALSRSSSSSSSSSSTSSGTSSSSSGSD